ncbi:hypothetical protein [Nonomuraea indica]|uniref:hypothetical protein n=1 Tax=Nonomuraea indica TaxID=1581193 RepID=UPI000C7D3244|nr:hypothetical protein [Nonomuraea indica]
MAYMPASSKEALRVPYHQDATAYPVEIAVVRESEGEPADSDYHPAQWDGGAATIIIGAGSDVPLTPGSYVVWTRLTTATERPVRRSGTLTVGEA